ncbi:Undecaprenyl diphosphate synthase [Microthyrium microscopicum]|uniref:ditrans,polycis-polyprenyl diphosphate synthase [(2E,6E)-farnesyldiphosphate specific] n=1 Tax=Microthyrium microscopicum TaxID=703497 RepID=A0A6A6UUQ0_9PEZI|nr:Undecaprenyl diphosphate synthase [Microthyrium microscopicum]
MLSARQTAAFYDNSSLEGHELSARERESIMKPLLPEPPSNDSKSTVMLQERIHQRAESKRKERKKPIRTTLRHWLYMAFHTIIHIFFGIHIRIRKSIRAVKHRWSAVFNYHHRTPELIRKDMKNISKMPQHLSVALELNTQDDRQAAMATLVNDVGDLTSWCAASGISFLSVYEKTGVLKRTVPELHIAISQTLHRYFARENTPHLSIRVSSEPAYSPPTTPPNQPNAHSPFTITVLLLSADDGRSSMVDLAKVLAGMAQKGNLAPVDINADLIDAELTELVMDEPELLILFGPRVVLDGYPPWQVRLTEIFHLPDYTEGVSYSVFTQALNNYASAQKRFGT